jgi:peptidoglycan/xylan/chitin deacetylase (PgdA/CDA1 family)
VPNFIDQACASLRGMRKAFARADKWLISVLFGADQPIGPSSDRAESGAEVAHRPLYPALSAPERVGEAVMRMSRAKKAVLVGVVLLAVGLTGRASAESTSGGSGALPAAAPGASPAPSKAKPGHAKPGQAKPASGKPASGKPASGKPASGKPAAAPGKGPKHTPPAKGKPSGRNISYKGGPAGSRTTTGGKGVALTFDDGPDPATTPRLLKLLARQHVKATFCLVGQNAARHPELVRQIVAGGHTLCNHTWDHSLKIGKEPVAKIRADLARTNAAILRAVPKAKIKYFRAPGGNFTPRLVGVAGQLRMTSIYWKVDPRDWDHPKGETPSAHRAKVIAKIEKHAGPGAIILSHDYAQPDTIAAYRTLIPYLRKHYKLIALP